MEPFINLEDLKNYIRILAQLGLGIDPTSGLDFSQDTILQNPKLQFEFRGVANLLIELLNLSEGKSSYLKKTRIEKFIFLKTINTDSIQCSSDPVPISKLLNLMKNALQYQGNLLKGTTFTSWLVRSGYLEVVENHIDPPYKIPTLKGKELGIIYIIKTNSIGHNYSLNLYDPNAQRFLIKNLKTIILEEFL